MSDPIDQAIQNWMVDHRSPWLTHVAWAVTTLGTTVFVSTVVVLIGVVLAWRHRHWIPVVACVTADLAAEVTARSFKQLIGRPRPPAAEAIEHLANSSMPSGHVARAALWCTLGVLALPASWRRRAAVAAIVVAVAVAWTRVYLGSHWFTDTVVAWPLGVAAGWAAHRLISAVSARRHQGQDAGSSLA